MKQVIIVRTDLKMGKGKIAAQCAHASLGAVEIAQKTCQYFYEEWKASGGEKVVVKVKSKRKLLSLFRKAEKAGLPCYVVSDAGRTQVPSGTLTVAAIGPAPEQEIDEITRELPLL